MIGPIDGFSHQAGSKVVPVTGIRAAVHPSKGKLMGDFPRFDTVAEFCLTKCHKAVFRIDYQCASPRRN